MELSVLSYLRDYTPNCRLARVPVLSLSSTKSTLARFTSSTPTWSRPLEHSREGGIEYRTQESQPFELSRRTARVPMQLTVTDCARFRIPPTGYALCATLHVQRGERRQPPRAT